MRYYCVAIGDKEKIVYLQGKIMKNLFRCFISPLNLKYKNKLLLWGAVYRFS